ncbi:MAG: DUF4468 domain-containing protein [Treponema sp.]|nr:DUF4468 domain-containing protein [Treponema sp.]
MKKWFWLAGAISAVSLVSCATPQKVSTEDASYSETVNVSGMQKDELFNRINMWCADTFKGPDANFNVPEKSRVVSANRDQGLISANHTLITNWANSGASAVVAIVYSGISIYVSDGQYRLTCAAKDFQTYAPIGGTTGYSKKFPFDGRLVNAARTSWQQLADALRDTVSGTAAN